MIENRGTIRGRDVLSGGPTTTRGPQPGSCPRERVGHLRPVTRIEPIPSAFDVDVLRREDIEMVKLHELPGSAHPAPKGMRPAGRIDAAEPITVSLYLKPRIAPADGRPQQRAALRQARETAHAEDCAAIRAYAADKGLEVVEESPGRRLIKLRGPASAIEQAFGTELHQFAHGGQSCRGRAGPLFLPASLVDRVLAILGLDTSPIATPKFVPHRGPNPPAGFLPNQIAALYGFTQADATGECIAIIELGGGYTDEDNRVAFGAMGLAVPEIVDVPVDGAGNSPGSGNGADGEVALDIQVAGGIAPGAKIAVYFAPNTSQGFADAISQAVHDEKNKPSAISISWGSPEDGWSGQAIAAMSAAFQDAARLGITVTAASGDALATDGEADGHLHVDYPASDPAVLGCGGTRITASGDRIAEEIVWKSNGGGSGGGVSMLFARPDYQAEAGVPVPASGKGGRGVPDVAGDADPDSGYRIVTGGQTGIIGGTSAVAPLWAGIAALLNARGGGVFGQPHAKLYGAPAALRDIVAGNNKSGSVGFSARAGWDACTGLGSPNGAKLIGLFGGKSVP
jgi:kumamolisin